MLHEPMLLVGAFLAAFLAAVAYARLVGGGEGSAAARTHSSTRVGECVARLRDVLERRARLHAALDEAVGKLGKTRNRAAFDSESAAVGEALEECARENMRLAGELEALDEGKAALARQVDAAERARQVQQRAPQSSDAPHLSRRRTWPL